MFCGKLLTHRITEHWQHVHEEELQVGQICSASGRRKNILVTRLRNLGNFKHNIKVLQGGGDRIIPVRRKNSSERLVDFLPCVSCYGFYHSKELWRHASKCPLKSNKQESSQHATIQAEARLMLKAAVMQDSILSEDAEIMDKLKTRKDEIGRQIEGDTLILKMANILFKKLGSRRKNDISQRARQLARLKMEVNKMKSEENTLMELICGKKYDNVLAAVHQLAGLYENEENVNRFEKPGLALRLGHNLVKAADIKFGMSLRSEDTVGLRESETFLKLIKSEFKDSVTSVALATLRTNKFNKGEILPLTEDLTKLKKYLTCKMKQLIAQMKSPSYEFWRELAEVTLSRILLFNKRRSAETSKLLLSAYGSRPNWKETANQEIFDSLSPLEQNMFDRYNYFLNGYSVSLS